MQVRNVLRIAESLRSKAALANPQMLIRRSMRVGHPAFRHCTSSPKLAFLASNGMLLKGSRRLDILSFADPRSFSSQVDARDVIMGEGWPAHEFSNLAETCLEYIADLVSDRGNSNESGLDGFDVEFSQGVLTITFGVDGTYVLNTQTPNRQIWMSSPVSGPWRYAWNPTNKQWISTRDGHHLSQRLSEELTSLFGEPVRIDFEETVLQT